MSLLPAISKDFYICTRQPDGRESINHHFVTDGEKLLAAQQRNLDKESDPAKRSTVRRATEAEYRKAMGWKGY